MLELLKAMIVRDVGSMDAIRAGAEVPAGSAARPGPGAQQSRPYEVMSYPGHGMLDTVFEDMAVGFCRLVCERFLYRVGPMLEQRDGPGLERMVQGALDRDIPLVTAWHPVFGAMADILRARGRLTPPDAAARLGLWLAACGYPGHWEIALDAPARLRWGPWPLPAAQRLRLESDGQVACLVLRAPDAPPRRFDLVQVCAQNAGEPAGQRAYQNARAPHAWAWSEEPGPPAPVTLQECHPVLFLFAAAGHAPALPVPQEQVLPAARAEPVVGQYRDALALMRQHAPDHLRWVDRVVRQVIPLRAQSNDGQLAFGSSAGQPGMCQLAFDSGPMALATALVHEASQHYFHLLCRIGPVDDGCDATEYATPHGRRSIGASLQAYHALANVVLFHRACRAAGYPDRDGELARMEQAPMPQLRALEEGLGRTHALTRMGQGLWDALRRSVL